VQHDLLAEVEEVGADDPGDMQLDDDAAQNGTIAMDREWRMAQAEEERRRSDEADAGIARIDSGTYGRCEGCGGWISRERLEAEPATRHCLRCEGLKEG